MHNNCQQLDGTLLPLPSPHSSSSFSSVVAATVTINFRISAAFSQNEVVDIVRHVEPHSSIHMQGYVCVYWSTQLLARHGIALAKSKLA